MKEKITNLFLVGAAMLALTACSGEDLNETANVSLNATSTTNTTSQDILPSDLVGTWSMYSMASMETAVDFDQDGNYTNDLLEETDCFDPMYFVFYENAEVRTRQARLYFNAMTGAFTCQTTGDYTATYSVSGNILSVTFTVSGSQYTETRTISRYSESGNEFLMVTLTKEETNAAVYVAKDPGTTVASEIQKIEMVYIKA